VSGLGLHFATGLGLGIARSQGVLKWSTRCQIVGRQYENLKSG